MATVIELEQLVLTMEVAWLTMDIRRLELETALE